MWPVDGVVLTFAFEHVFAYMDWLSAREKKILSGKLGSKNEKRVEWRFELMSIHWHALKINRFRNERRVYTILPPLLYGKQELILFSSKGVEVTEIKGRSVVCQV